MLAQLDQAHALFQAQCAQFGADLIRAKIVINRLTDHGVPPFFSVKKMMPAGFS